MNLKTPRLEQELAPSVWTLFSKGPCDLLKAGGGKGGTEGDGTLREVNQTCVCTFSAIRSFVLGGKRTLAEEISADNNGGPKRRLVV